MAAGKVEEEAIPSVNPRRRHIKKRALKNEALVVTFNEKDLSDFVSGFHKRKKKRRKEAEQKQGEALRLKLLELRKKRRLEKELVLGGGIAQATDTAADEVDEGVEEHEDDEISETSGAANSCCRSPYNVYFSLVQQLMTIMVKVTVTTHEIFREEESDQDEKTKAAVPESVGASKKHNVPVRKMARLDVVLK